MAMLSDPRIEVVFTGGAAADGYLVEAGQPAPSAAYVMRFALAGPGAGHAFGCACCAPRGPAVTALAAMFRARATGEAPFFSRVAVIASAAGQKAVREAMDDIVVAARYRME